MVVFCFYTTEGNVSAFIVGASAVPELLGHTVASSDVNKPTSSDVHPSSRRLAPTRTAPPIMNGRLLPYFDVERSDMAPTMGCMMRPESGPAIHTREVFDFVSPNRRR
jgi:hypothetical protein